MLIGSYSVQCSPLLPSFFPFVYLFFLVFLFFLQCLFLFFFTEKKKQTDTKASGGEPRTRTNHTGALTFVRAVGCHPSFAPECLARQNREDTQHSIMEQGHKSSVAAQTPSTTTTPSQPKTHRHLFTQRCTPYTHTLSKKHTRTHASHAGTHTHTDTLSDAPTPTHALALSDVHSSN